MIKDFVNPDEEGIMTNSASAISGAEKAKLIKEMLDMPLDMPLMQIGEEKANF